ncbi:M48 family metalloprotease [Paenibacillus sp. WQ 127069]|uniref:M48 family metalloprotease n=1 Tax=Paenibacillus baimaensis TaxID=2982185 RepID=A0ABT2UBU2_9BACL|nr:M56 family metallopeptidase [Paenibacillus sp. WQ 127069]MCU6792094.1 M48 family metalloprotease [Paenibacillus sp. WQ 127069]
MNQITEQLIKLFDWVWSVSIMASVLVVLIIVMQRVLKHRLKPRWHYLMWLLVIVRLMLPWGPESEFSIYNWTGYTDSVHSTVHVIQEERVAEAALPEKTTAQKMYRNVFVVWLIGVCVLGAYTFWINRRFAQQMSKESVMITDARILELFNQCKQMMSIHKPISLVESPSTSTPTLFGMIKPQLIMPQAILNRLNDDQLQHVFLHELAHSKRNDIAVNWFMHILLIIHWFNPVLWYAYRRMREDQEIASDALALSYLAPDKSQDYGHTLIKLLENFSQPARIAGNVNLTGSKAQLQRRITMIKQFKSNSYRWSFLGIAAIIFISGCTLTNPKTSETASQSPNKAISEEKNKQSASLESNTPSNQDKPGTSDSAGTPSTLSETKPTLTASTETQPAVEGKSGTAAPVVSQPAVVDDKPQAGSVEKPMLFASTSQEPAVKEDKPRPVASVRQPAVLDDRPRPAAVAVPELPVSDEKSRPAPAPAAAQKPMLLEDTTRSAPAAVPLPPVSDEKSKPAPAPQVVVEPTTIPSS